MDGLYGYVVCVVCVCGSQGRYVSVMLLLELMSFRGGEGKERTQLNGFRVLRSLFSYAGKAGAWNRRERHSLFSSTH